MVRKWYNSLELPSIESFAFQIAWSRMDSLATSIGICDHETVDRERLVTWIRSVGEENFSRSGGPGGQNVNKVNTKVVLKIPVENIPEIGEDELLRLKEKLGNRLTNENELLIQASEERTQLKNRKRAEERAADLILEAVRPIKKRKPTKPSKAAKERRIEKKKKRSRLKKNRREPGID